MLSVVLLLLHQHQKGQKMSEFLHKVVANREYIQRDRELQAELREAIAFFRPVSDPWVEEEEDNG